MARQRLERVSRAARADSSLQATAAQLRPVVLAGQRFAAAIEARSIAMMLRHDLTMPQLRTVMIIRHMGRANGRQLATALRLTPGAIVAICDHLEQREYVRRVADTNDRRITWFELTDRGAVALKATPAIAIAKSRTKAVLAGLTSSEREGFIKVANAFADALESVFAADLERTG